MPKGTFLKHRIRSVGIAFKGMTWLLRNESNAKVQGGITLVVTCAGWYWNISATEWILQCLTIGLVMGLEGFNTAIEKLSDYIQPQHDPKIGLVKDIAAGAVLLASILASIIGLIIYVPKIF